MRAPDLRDAAARVGWFLLGLLGLGMVCFSVMTMGEALTTGVIDGGRRSYRLVYFNADPGGYTFHLLKQMLQTVLGVTLTAAALTKSLRPQWLDAFWGHWIAKGVSKNPAANAPSTGRD